MKKTALLLLLAGPLCMAGTVDFYIGTTGEHMYEVSWDGKRFSTPLPFSAPQCSYAQIAGPDEVFVTSTTPKAAALATYKGRKMTSTTGEPSKSSCFILKAGHHPYILTTQYGYGSLSVNRLYGTQMGEMVQSFKFTGSGPHRNQKSAHLHQVRQLPASMAGACGIGGEWYLATDLGSDKIYLFEYVEHSPDSILCFHPELTVSHKPGSGPRHMEFNSKFNLVYCVTELSDEVVTFRLSGKDGKPLLTEISRIHADEAYAGGGADIHLTPDGRFLYSSHRLKADGVAVFSVSQTDGSLSRTGYFYTEKHPRNFVIAPDGSCLFVACRDGKCIQIFDIDKKNGKLKERRSRRLVLDEAPLVIIVKPES